MPNTPLNPEALEAAARATYEMRNPESWAHSWEELDLEEREEEWVKPARTVATSYLTVAQPEVTGEQVNLAGWTCNGIHEPVDYSTCEECRDACDDIARFYNHMMRNPRPFKHWTGSTEVKP